MEQENNKMNLPERDSPAYPLAGGPQMTIDESCQQLSQYLEDILRGAGQARLNVDRLSHPCRPLGNALASFQETFLDLFGGGRATLELDDPSDILECGIEIKVQPPGSYSEVPDW